MHALRAPNVDVNVPARSRRQRALRSPTERPVLDGGTVVAFLAIVLVAAAWAVARRGRILIPAPPAGGEGEGVMSDVTGPGTGNDEQPTVSEPERRASIGDIGTKSAHPYPPEVFYRAAVEREDVREILQRLADA